MLAFAWGNNSIGPARQDANRFILETLKKQSGDNWEIFKNNLFWDYHFENAGCDLSIRRSDGNAMVFTQVIPMAHAQPTAEANGEVRFDCINGNQCVLAKHYLPDEPLKEFELADTTILLMDSLDGPRMINALVELHQLCRDPYSAQRR